MRGSNAERRTEMNIHDLKNPIEELAQPAPRARLRPAPLRPRNGTRA
jgi:hypothetical protein